MSQQNERAESPGQPSSKRRCARNPELESRTASSNEGSSASTPRHEISGKIFSQWESSGGQQEADSSLQVLPGHVDHQDSDQERFLPVENNPPSLQLQQLITENVKSKECSNHCPICLELLGDCATIMPCGHQFDLACLKVVSYILESLLRPPFSAGQQNHHS